MSKWNLIVDVARCSNCHNCTLAVKDEYVGNRFEGYSAPQPLHGQEWIRIERRVRGAGHMVDAAYVPMMCNHCDNPPCLKAAGESGAVRKRDDGIVIIDPVKARGRKDLVDACPYGNICWNEEEQVPQAWFFDAHLLDSGWKEPRCSQSCANGAIEALKVDDAEMQRMAVVESLRVLRPELGTRPRVWYRNLHRFDQEFIGGSVVTDINGVTECVEGATVVLRKGEVVLAEQRTDMFGDFKFDALEAGSGTYRLIVQHPEFGEAVTEATLGESMHAGSISLQR